jgi:Fur family ferric uptake transcriptional regulator
MCNQCNYTELLVSAKLEATSNRLRVLEVIGGNRYPLSAADIFKTLQRVTPINRVTVYRILDLLVDRGVADRISTGGRSFYYGLAPNDHHHPHPHFYCKSCGHMDCLDPQHLEVDTDPLRTTFPGRIDKVEVRVDGICKNCLRSQKQGLGREKKE